MRLFISNQGIKFDARYSGTDGSLQFKAQVDPTGTGQHFVTMDITTNGPNVSDNTGDVHKGLTFDSLC